MLQDFVASHLAGRKFIVVGHREPFVHRRSGGQVECLRPASGMAAALHPILAATGGTWVARGSGDADQAMADEHGRLRVPPGSPQYTLRRVWLTPEDKQGFYDGLCNEALWPLCHITFTRPVFRQEDWDSYQRVNAQFAQAVLEEAGDEPALVFIQDYHFGLLPAMLRELAGERFLLGHFWHIPWPNPETFRAFPWREELLEGLLGNDLLGFQIRHHCHNFLDTVERATEKEVNHEQFEIRQRAGATSVRAFPISIDFQAHAAQAGEGEVAAAMETWSERLRLSERVLGVGLDRLDYTKGIIERLRGVDQLLNDHPGWRGRLVFIQGAVPTRSSLPEYRKVESEVEFLVERINALWSTDDWSPVVLLKEHLADSDLIALHRLAAFCVVSSLHDGMNLVAKEFVASRVDEQGVLILSRFTGAHRELREALEINPFAIHEIGEAMHDALEMPAAEQRRRMQRLRRQVAQHNVYRWAGRFLATLLREESAGLMSMPRAE